MTKAQQPWSRLSLVYEKVRQCSQMCNNPTALYLCSDRRTTFFGNTVPLSIRLAVPSHADTETCLNLPLPLRVSRQEDMSLRNACTFQTPLQIPVRHPRMGVKDARERRDSNDMFPRGYRAHRPEWPALIVKCCPELSHSFRLAHCFLLRDHRR